MRLVCVGGGNAVFFSSFPLLHLLACRCADWTRVWYGVLGTQGPPADTVLYVLHTAGCLSIMEIAPRLYRRKKGKGQLFILLLDLFNSSL